MLLITDRLEEGRRLQQALGPYRTCDVISLLEALAHAPGQSCIMLDLALDNVTTVELVRAALAHHRTAPTIPVLCLTRDPSKLALAQARALGATETIPHNSPVAQIRSAIDRMTISLQSAKADEVTRRATQHKVLEAGSAFSDLFEAARCRREVGWNCFWRDLQRDEAIRSCGEVNALIGELFGKGFPAVDLPQCDLS